MTIEVIRQNDILPIGSVCEVIRRCPLTKRYLVWNCSIAGTYRTWIKEKFVEILK